MWHRLSLLGNRMYGIPGDSMGKAADTRRFLLPAASSRLSLGMPHSLDTPGSVTLSRHCVSKRTYSMWQSAVTLEKKSFSPLHCLQKQSTCFIWGHSIFSCIQYFLHYPQGPPYYIHLFSPPFYCWKWLKMQFSKMPGYVKRPTSTDLNLNLSFCIV